MGTNMYPSSSLLGQDKDASIAALPVDELIEKTDGFAGVFPEHKYEIVKKLQEKKHICGMTGDGVNDAPALKKADIGIAVADATNVARGASNIVFMQPGLSVIISAVLTSRAIFQRMKNCTIYVVSITIRIVLGFMLMALIRKFDFSRFMVLIIAILNDGTIMTISKDRVKPSPLPNSWKLKEIFATGVVLGSYLALMTVIFFWTIKATDFFSVRVTKVTNTKDTTTMVANALMLTYETSEVVGRCICGPCLIKTSDLIEKLRKMYPNYNYPKKTKLSDLKLTSNGSLGDGDTWQERRSKFNIFFLLF